MTSMIGISLPGFWFGLLLQMIFAIGLGWLPSSGRATPGGDDLVEPPAAPGAADRGAGVRPGVGLVALPARLDDRDDPAAVHRRGGGARPAAARGWFCVTRCATRSGRCIAIVTVDAALLVSGAVVTESVFAWPGLGSLFTEALARRDYTVLMALLMLSSSAVIVFNVVADALHAVIDPRVAG